MNNALLILKNGDPFIVVAVQKHELLTIERILDIYSALIDIPRPTLTGRWIQAIDITNIDESGCAAKMPYAKSPWP